MVPIWLLELHTPTRMSSNSRLCMTPPQIAPSCPFDIANLGWRRNLSSSSLPRSRTPPSTSSSRNRFNDATPPPPRGSAASTSPPFKSYINFLSNTNDDWKADEDGMLGYEDDDGDDFGLPSLSNMKRRSKRIATQNKSDLSHGSSIYANDGSFGGIRARRYSNSADISAERPAPTYPMPKKSEGKILRPQYKDILKG